MIVFCSLFVVMIFLCSFHTMTDYWAGAKLLDLCVKQWYNKMRLYSKALRQYKDAQKETEVLMKALSTMQDKNAELENNLCAETRFKQDLFSALGKERNEIKILQSES